MPMLALSAIAGHAAFLGLCITGRSQESERRRPSMDCHTCAECRGEQRGAHDPMHSASHTLAAWPHRVRVGATASVAAAAGSTGGPGACGGMAGSLQTRAVRSSAAERSRRLPHAQRSRRMEPQWPRSMWSAGTLRAWGALGVERACACAGGWLVGPPLARSADQIRMSWKIVPAKWRRSRGGCPWVGRGRHRGCYWGCCVSPGLQGQHTAARCGTP